MLAILIVGQSPAQGDSAPRGYRFVVQDGNDALVLSAAASLAYFTDADFPAGLVDDRGSRFKDCSDALLKCAQFLGITIAVPRAKDFPKEWKASGVRFSIKQTYNIGHGKVYLIETVSENYELHFIYSKSRGVEMFTARMPFGPPAPEKAFISVDEKGLFAD